MKCKGCGYVIAYDPEREGKDETCVICGERYRDDPDDILLHGKYGIAREVRPTQADMAREIDDLIYRDARGTLYAEGGTGIGKSFAYLIPAILAGKRVVVSTAKKSLQHQLVEKDLPLLASKMGKDIQFGVYKGKANYGCVKCASSIKTKVDRNEFIDWATKLMMQHEAADIAKWPGSRPKWWDDITVENCPQKRGGCEHAEYCKPQPKEWDIIVVNHTLMAIDLLMGTQPGFLIGDYPIVVIDEAHKAPEMFRSAVTESITLWSTSTLLKRFENDDELHAELSMYGRISEKEARKAFTQIRDIFKDMHERAFRGASSPKETIRLRSLLPFKNSATKLQEEVGELKKRLGDTSKGLYADIENHNTSTPIEKAQAVLGRMEKLTRKLQMLHDIVGSLLDEIAVEEAKQKLDEAPKEGNWIIIVDDKGIHRKPVHIGNVCGKALASRLTHRIIVSATLTIGGNFEFMRKEFGIDDAIVKLASTDKEHSVEAVYASPFDLKDQALLYTPATIPVPAHPNTERRHDWITAITQEIERLVLASQGDAFVLFSAKADLNEVLAGIDEQNLLSHGIKIHAHINDIDAQKLTQDFMKTPSSVLFGLKSFWEGVDIPGDKLRLVVIPKLPFPNPKDPVIEALSELAKVKGENSFITVSVPQMLFDLKQAVGRLIRTKTDKGVVAILDSRVWTGTSNQLRHERTLADIRRMRAFLRDNPDQRARFKDEGSYRGYGKRAVDATGFLTRTPSFTKAEAFVKKS